MCIFQLILVAIPSSLMILSVKNRGVERGFYLADKTCYEWWKLFVDGLLEETYISRMAPKRIFLKAFFAIFWNETLITLSKVTQDLKMQYGLLFHAIFYGAWHEKIFRSQSCDIWSLGPKNKGNLGSNDVYQAGKFRNPGSKQEIHFSQTSFSSELSDEFSKILKSQKILWP